MKDCEFTLELSDGTVVRVAAMANTQHPDVKAFYFPPGALTPFSHQNLPKAPRGGDHADVGLATQL